MPRAMKYVQKALFGHISWLLAYLLIRYFVVFETFADIFIYLIRGILNALEYHEFGRRAVRRKVRQHRNSWYLKRFGVKNYQIFPSLISRTIFLFLCTISLSFSVIYSISDIFSPQALRLSAQN